jgi:hypothetical protein
VPVHTAAWNNSSPVGSDLASSIDDFMRAMKLDVDERMSLAHYWGDATAVGNNQDGTHKEITITPATTNTPVLKTNANQSLTGSDASAAIDLGITWNTTGAPAAIKANITNTASGAAAKLIDLQIGGTSRFNVDKVGNVNAVSAANVVLTLGSAAAGSQAVAFQDNAVTQSLITAFNTNVFWDCDGAWNWRTLNAVTTRMALSSSGNLTLQGTLAVGGTTTSTGALAAPTLRATTGGLLRPDGSANAITLGDGTNQHFGTLQVKSTGGTTRWEINNTGGHLIPGAASTYDIGSSSVRVNNIFGVNLNVLNAGGTITGSGGSLTLPGGLLTGGNVTVNADGGGVLVGATFGQQAQLYGRGSAGAAPHLILENGDSQCAYIELETNGTFYALWVDSSGKLRVNTAPPANSGGTGTGTVVGTQS